MFSETNTEIRELMLAGLIAAGVLTGAGLTDRTHLAAKTTCGKYAYIDKRGAIVFRTTTDPESENFSEGVLKIKSDADGEAADITYVDTQGNVIAHGFRRGRKFSEGVAEVGDSGRVGFIDKTGKVVIPQLFSDALSFREGMAPAMVNKGFGFIDSTGKIVIPPFFENATGFSEGLAAVTSQGKIGFIDLHGQWRIKPRFNYVDGFSDGLALVREEGEQFYIDHDGHTVITLNQEEKKRPFSAWGASETGLSSSKGFFQGFNSRTFADPCTFRDGLSPMYEDGKFGYIDKAGKFVIRPAFDLAFPFVEGIARVCVEKKWGFIDKAGTFVIEPKYSEAEDFREGAAAVAVGEDKWGHIYKSGKFMVEPKYVSVGPFRDGRARVQLEP